MRPAGLSVPLRHDPGRHHLSGPAQPARHVHAPDVVVVATGLAPYSFYELDADGNRQPAHYDALPVEFIATAMSTLGVHATGGFYTYHTINPHDDSIGLDTYIDWLIDAGYPIHRVADYAQWYARMESALRNLPQQQRQHSLLPLIQSYQSPCGRSRDRLRQPPASAPPCMPREWLPPRCSAHHRAHHHQIHHRPRATWATSPINDHRKGVTVTDMHETAELDAYYDPYDFAIDDDPYPVWKRLRQDAPLYHNDKYGFYALSRYTDVAKGLYDWETFRSGRGTVLDIITSGMEIPSGLVLFEDPPLHDMHRRVLSRVFTPRRMSAVEPLAREFTRAALDPLVGSDSFDFIDNLGAWMPMRTIGALLGIPEDDQTTMRDNTDNAISLKRGVPAKQATRPRQFVPPNLEMIAEYVDWRAKNPADDLMTELVNAEVVDEDSGKRPLTRSEVLTYISTIMGAGSETTTRLIGFAGQLLSDHPDQRREIAADHSLIPNAVEEVLRYEAPSPVQARYVAAYTEHYGQTVPEGSVMLLINGSANRDERHYPDADRFDIHRRASHSELGQGLHFCLGAALARMEARVALEEVLTRWPDWNVDYANAVKAHTASVRGWAKLPVRT